MTVDQVMAWSSAFVAAQAEMPDVPKGKKATIPTKSGGSFTYAYADLPSIIDLVRPVLSKHGLAVAQSVEQDGGVAVITRIYHSGGHVESFGPVVLPAADDARSVGSAITYARRYSLCAALGIAADEDDDAASAESSNRAGAGSGTRGSPARPDAQEDPAPADTFGSDAGTEPSRKAEAGGEGVGTPPTPASPDCQHEEIEPLRGGWVKCRKCGHPWKAGG